jgi:hypothetical protein
MGHGIGSEADDRTGVPLDGGEAWRDTHRDGDLGDGGSQPLVIWSSDRDAQTVLVLLERQTSLGRPSHRDLPPLSVSVRGSFPNWPTPAASRKSSNPARRTVLPRASYVCYPASEQRLPRLARRSSEKRSSGGCRSTGCGKNCASRSRTKAPADSVCSCRMLEQATLPPSVIEGYGTEDQGAFPNWRRRPLANQGVPYGEDHNS